MSLQRLAALCFAYRQNWIATIFPMEKSRNDTRIFKVPYVLALLKSVKAKRLNGFDYWLVERNGKQILLDNVRNEYRKFRASA